MLNQFRNQRGIAFLLVMVILGIAMVAAFTVMTMSRGERYVVEGFAAQKRVEVALPGVQQVVRDLWRSEASAYKSNTSINQAQLETFRGKANTAVAAMSASLNGVYGGNGSRTMIEASVPGPFSLYYVTATQRSPQIASGANLQRTDSPSQRLDYAQINVVLKYYPQSKQSDSTEYAEASLPVKLWYQGASGVVLFETDFTSAADESLFDVINNGKNGNTWNNSSLQRHKKKGAIFKQPGTYKLFFPNALTSWPADYTIKATCINNNTSGIVGVYYRVSDNLDTGYVFQINRSAGSFYVRQVISTNPVAIALISKSFSAVPGFSAGAEVELTISVQGDRHRVWVKQGSVESLVFDFTNTTYSSGFAGLYGYIEGNAKNDIMFYEVQVTGN